MLFIGKQGWQIGKRTRLPPLWRAAQIPALNSSVSLLLVLSFAPRGFSPGIPVFPAPKKFQIPI